jgi:hypothetical protein
MIALDLRDLWASQPDDVIHAAIAGAMGVEPSTLAGAIAAMVRGSTDEEIAALVGPEMLRRLGGDARTELAATWEQACDAARAEAQQARRSAVSAAQRAEARARADYNTILACARAHGQAEDERDALFALGWLAVVQRDQALAWANDANAQGDRALADAGDDVDVARSIGHARARRLIAALRAARATIAVDLPPIAPVAAPIADRAAGVGAFTSVFSVAPVPPSSGSRRAPAPPSVTAIQGPPSSRPDVAPLVALLSEERAPTPPRPVYALASKLLAATQPTAPARVSLTILPIADITSPVQHFACAPLRATISAASCVSRQHAADPVARKLLSPGERVATGGAGSYGACKACPDGQKITAQLAGKTRKKPARRAAVEAK